MDSSKFKKVEAKKEKKHKKRASNSYQKNYKPNKQYYKKNRHNNKLKKSKQDYLYHREDKKKKNRGINFKAVGIILIILILLFVGYTSINMLKEVSHSSIPSNAVQLIPSDFDYKTDGYYFDNSLTGNFVGTNQNGTQTYFLSQDQLIALAVYSNNTFNYSDGIYVTYKQESSIYNDINVVEAIYLNDGTQLTIPDDYDTSYFISNSKKIGSSSKYCTKSFGYSGEDYYKVN